MSEVTTGQPVTSVQWIHSARKTTDDVDVVVVKEKIVTELDGKIIDSRNNLRYIHNPKRKFWVTKPQFRTHRYKKETELMERCDEYAVEDKDLLFKLKQVLGLPKFARMSLRKICNSPYVYGADVPVENLIRMKYIKSQKHPLVKYSIGSLDIEKSVLGCERINVVSFVHEREVYCSILDDFLYKNRNNKRVKADIEDVKKTVEELIGPMLKEHGFNVIFAVHDNELNLLKWLFSNVHKHETDFVGIWNMDYDISRIIERIRYYEEDPEDVFCPSTLPKLFRMAKYKQDKRNTAHITDKWHWMFCTGGTQYVDKMNLYARNRKGKSKLNSYKFDDVVKADLGMKKLNLEGDEDGDHSLEWHRKMQRDNFLAYIAYNIVDAVVLQLHEEKCKDIQAMMGLLDVSHPFEYSKQTNMLRDTETVYCAQHGRVFATAGEEMEGPYDKLLGKAGGTVLRTEKVTGVGLHALEEQPHVETRALCMVGDNDYGSVYPTMKIINGIDKETKLYTVITIEGMSKSAVEELFSCISSPKENAVYVGQKFFNLPGYEEMDQLFGEYITIRSRIPDPPNNYLH